MATTERAVKLTYEDYCTTPDDKRCELLNGDLTHAVSSGI